MVHSLRLRVGYSQNLFLIFSHLRAVRQARSQGQEQDSDMQIIAGEMFTTWCGLQGLLRCKVIPVYRKEGMK